MAHSTKPPAGDKAGVLAAARKFKVKEKLPLLVHTSLRWARKVNGRLHYFGKVDGKLGDFGAAAALEEYHRTVDDLRVGRVPRPKDDELLRLKDGVNAFLTAKESRVKTGELARRSFANYHATCSRIIDVLGRDRAVMDLSPGDFRKLREAFAKGRGVVSLGNDVRHARILFKFLFDEGLIERPVRYGQAFDPPSKKSYRVARAAKGPRMFEAEELRRIIDAADHPLKAMILLGANCAFGQADLARLPKTAIDLKNGWVTFHRHKTGIGRRVPLWLETTDALREALAVRPEPANPADANLIFLTPTGLPVVRSQVSQKKAKAAEKAKSSPTTADVVQIDTVGAAMAALLKDLGVNGGRGFYALRHGFETIGGATGDQVAVSAIMGHAPRSGDMSAVYRERIDDDRLQKVVDHVHAWLYGSEDKE